MLFYKSDQSGGSIALVMKGGCAAGTSVTEQNGGDRTGGAENIACQTMATRDIFTDQGGYHVCIDCARRFERQQQEQ